MQISIYATNTYKNDINPCHFQKDYMVFDENDEKFEEILKGFSRILSDSQYDLSSFGYEGIRVVITRMDEKHPESVKFRLSENGELGVFQNWMRDKDKPFSSAVWKMWSFLNDKLLAKQATNLSKGA